MLKPIDGNGNRYESDHQSNSIGNENYRKYQKSDYCVQIALMHATLRTNVIRQKIELMSSQAQAKIWAGVSPNSGASVD